MHETYYYRPRQSSLPPFLSHPAARLLLIQHRRCGPARRRETYRYVCDLQYSERYERCCERGDGICDDGRELQRVEREDQHGVDVCVERGCVGGEEVGGGGGGARFGVRG